MCKLFFFVSQKKQGVLWRDSIECDFVMFYSFLKGLVMKLERDFQGKLIKEIKELLPGAIVLKNDPNYIQGIPDLLILYEKQWASLECKKSPSETPRPNQPYYVDLMNKMSFSRFINPENKEEVLNDLQQAFGVRR